MVSIGQLDVLFWWKRIGWARWCIARSRNGLSGRPLPSVSDESYRDPDILPGQQGDGISFEVRLVRP